MTYEQIEKEFDEYCLSASHTLGESLTSIQVYNHRKSDALMLKDFLKQSFIKYLQGEVEIIKEMEEDFSVNRHQVSGEVKKTQMLSKEKIIERLQAQIKSLEV